ncbi:hypothetical protein, partial [Ciceribacter ferrooxidans]|uniref:hypothetical protein n=1 Tax=Ciceribacter ferrooxidans TaxID=2509717 RepID=UPI0013EA7446
FKDASKTGLLFKDVQYGIIDLHLDLLLVSAQVNSLSLHATAVSVSSSDSKTNLIVLYLTVALDATVKIPGGVDLLGLAKTAKISGYLQILVKIAHDVSKGYFYGGAEGGGRAKLNVALPAGVTLKAAGQCQFFGTLTDSLLNALLPNCKKFADDLNNESALKDACYDSPLPCAY